MDSIITEKINTEKSTINVKNLIKKMTKLSFSADAIYKSKDWPYLWQKADSAKAVQKAITTDNELVKKKAWSRRFGKVFLWGIVSLSMYLALFLNQGIVTDYYTRGGFFTLAIVATAIIFALVHSTFAGHVLEKLNFKAANREKSGH